MVSDSNIVMSNELLDRSLRDEGLTSYIADLLSTLTGRVFTGQGGHQVSDIARQPFFPKGPI